MERTTRCFFVASVCTADKKMFCTAAPLLISWTAAAQAIILTGRPGRVKIAQSTSRQKKLARAAGVVSPDDIRWCSKTSRAGVARPAGGNKKKETKLTKKPTMANIPRKFTEN